MTRAAVVLALLAAAAIAALLYVLRWGLPWDDDSIGEQLRDDVDELYVSEGDWELWDRESRNRLGAGTEVQMRMLRYYLVRAGGDAEQLVIGRAPQPSEAA